MRAPTGQEASEMLLFLFFGMAWCGCALMLLAVFVGLRRLKTPKPEEAKS